MQTQKESVQTQREIVVGLRVFVIIIVTSFFVIILFVVHSISLKRVLLSLESRIQSARLFESITFVIYKPQVRKYLPK